MKKIFTLLSVALFAFGAYADTTISMAGLKFSNFSWQDTEYDPVSDFVEKDGDGNPTGYTAPYAFTYKGTNTDCILQLKSQSLKYSYKNSGEKAGFFSMTNDFFQVGGKSAKLIISDVKKEQTITLTIAAKEDGNAPTFSVSGATLKTGDPASATSKSTFVDLVYTVSSAGGVVTIENTANGYRIKTVKIEGEGVTPGGFVGNEMTVKWNLKTATANPPAGMTSSSVTAGDGVEILDATYKYNEVDYLKIQPKSTTDKGTNSYSSAQTLKKYVDFTFTPSATFEATKISFDAIKIATGDPQLFIDFIDGTGSTTTVADGLVIQKTGETSPAIGHSFDIATFSSDQPVTIRIYIGKCATNKQVGITNVVLTGKIDSSVPTGINTVKVAEATDGVIYNLAGQKVNENYKGVVIKDGKKMIQK